MSTDLKEPKPFHETILEILRDWNFANRGELILLSSLIKKTKIPKNHDEIMSELKRKARHLSCESFSFIKECEEILCQEKAKITAAQSI